MKYVDTLVIGAGPAGIGALDILGDECLVIEKSNCIGGLCGSFKIDGFTFDNAVHLSFSNSEIFNNSILNVEKCIHEPVSLNYYNSLWITHPAQNNLFPLPELEKNEILDGFKKRISKDFSEIKNYREWLEASFGVVFTDNFSEVYTRKYWCCNSYELSISWCGNRIYIPSIEEVEFGMRHKDTKNVYYAKEMRYPKFGGYRTFFERNSKNIYLNEEVKKIDPLNHIIYTSKCSYKYNNLLSSLPLKCLIDILSISVPDNIKIAAGKLMATSMALLSVAFNKNVKIPSLWFYIYDEKYPFARCYSPSLKSVDNAPLNCSSLQFEHYYKGHDIFSDEELRSKTIEFLVESKICSAEDTSFIDIRRKEFANVIFLQEMEIYRDLVIDYIKSLNIIPIGRFGEWKYLWSDQSYLSGYNAALKIKKGDL